MTVGPDPHGSAVPDAARAEVLLHSGNIPLHQGLRQLRKKYRRNRRLAHATPKTPLTGMGEEQTLFRPGDAHVAKTSFLLQ